MIEMIEKKRHFAIILTLLIGIEIFFFSSFTGTSGGSPGTPWLPRSYHFIVFFLFSFFLLASVKGDKKLKFGGFVIVLVLSVLYGVLDEFHQYFVPGRAMTISDVLTDSLGVFVAMFIYLSLEKYRKYK
jgi:VanZ family protein